MTIPCSKGFTLIEVLVAIAVGAFISLLSYELFSSALTVESKVTKVSTTTNDLQRTWQFLQSDLQHAVSRPWSDYLGSAQPAMLGKLGDRQSQSSELYVDDDAHLIRFVRAGDHNFLDQPRSNLQIVAYRLTEQKAEEEQQQLPISEDRGPRYSLWRDHWRPIESSRSPNIKSVLILSDINELRFRYLSKNSASVDEQAWIAGWPESTAQRDQLPAAVEITISVDNIGEVVRLFTLASGS